MYAKSINWLFFHDLYTEQCEIPIRGDAAALFPARLSNRLVGFSRIKDPMVNILKKKLAMVAVYLLCDLVCLL